MIARYETEQRDIQAYIEADTTSPHEPDHHRLLWLYRRYQDGVLPFTGGALDQPNWFVEDMQYCDLLAYYTDLKYQLASARQDLQRAMAKAVKEANGYRREQPH